ncbi:hypothetical protein F5887DRAFT_617834 [Amanita rubescens]|nr:hypothetical protein F5887DRAFT_617834 [Amanita rubescens]
MRIIVTRVRMSGDDDDDDNTDNVGDDVSTIPKDVFSDTQYSEPSSGQPTNAASPFSPTGEGVDGEEGQGLTNHEWMGGVAGYWKDGIKERWEALKARRGEPNADDAVTEMEACCVLDGLSRFVAKSHHIKANERHDFSPPLLRSRTGRSTGNEEDINEALGYSQSRYS